MYLIRILVNIVCLFAVTVSSCSIIPGTEQESYTMEETLKKASIVVSGTDVYHDETSDPSRNITFRVSCVFKDGYYTMIPRTIFLLNVGATTCDGTRLEEGKSYILGLKVASEYDITNFGQITDYYGKDSEETHYYIMDEPAILNSAAFYASPQNLSTAAGLCGMDNTIVSRGGSEPGDHMCPDRSFDDDSCWISAGAPRLTMVNLGIFILLLSMALLSITA